MLAAGLGGAAVGVLAGLAVVWAWRGPVRAARTRTARPPSPRLPRADTAAWCPRCARVVPVPARPSGRAVCGPGRHLIGTWTGTTTEETR